MSDDVDTLVTKHLPALTARVHKGMNKVEPKLAKHLPVNRSDDSSPFRLTGAISSEPVDGVDEEGLLRLETAIEGAFTLERTLDLDLERLRSGGEEAVFAQAEAFGTQVREAERRIVMRLVAVEATAGGAYDTATVTAKATECAGSVRLLGGGNVATAVKKAGAVEDVVPLPKDMPAEVAALLIPLTGGPVVERVVDDLTVTWRRVDKDAASLVIRGRFFVRRPETAFTFTPPAARGARATKRNGEAT